MMEVVHAMLGMVRAPVFTTFIQILSRVALVGVVDAFPSLHASTHIYTFAFAWSFTEVVRYAWYAINLLGKPPKAHTWLRYSTFTILYPLGVFGEMCLYVQAMPQLLTVPAITMSVPAFTVSLGAFVKYFVFVSYVPGLPILYMHMLSQRSKALASLSGKNKKQ